MQKRKALVEHKKFVASVRHAVKGFTIAFREEQNIRIHIFFACGVLLLALFFRVSLLEFIVLFISITLVVTLELINSIVERLCDMVRPQVSHLIAAVKDMSAATVLLSALNAGIVGVIIFFPKLFLFLQAVLF